MTPEQAAGWLARLGVAGHPAPSLDLLGQLIRAQLRSIPFETIDPFCGQVPRLAPEALQTKLIQHRRGGYCFELNSLLAAGLTALGFAVTHRLARVLWQRPEPGPWTHHVLHVEAEGRMWLVDAGFGGPGPDRPVPLSSLASGQSGGSDALRLGDAPGLGTMLSRRGSDGEWRPLYAFGSDVVGHGDLEAGNWLAATFPRSIFRTGLMAARGDGACRITLADGRLRRVEAGVETGCSEMATPEATLSTLEAEFGIGLSREARALLLQRLRGAPITGCADAEAPARGR